MNTGANILEQTYWLTIMASVAFGVVGSFVVARRVGYLTGAIAHSAFGGVGLGLWLQQRVALGAFGLAALVKSFGTTDDVDSTLAKLSEYIRPVPTALIFSILAAFLVDWIRRRASEREETLIGAIWAIGTAVGLLAIDRVSGYVSATTYLFGDVLLVTRADVVVAAILSALILVVALINFKKLEAVCFDEEFAELRGVNVARQNRLLLLLASITVVLLMRVVGMALIVALLTLPAATACRFTKRLGTTMCVSTGICLVGSLLGVKISYELNFSAGPTITLIVALFYVLALVVPAACKAIARK